MDHPPTRISDQEDKARYEYNDKPYRTDLDGAAHGDRVQELLGDERVEVSEEDVRDLPTRNALGAWILT